MFTLSQPSKAYNLKNFLVIANCLAKKLNH